MLLKKISCCLLFAAFLLHVTAFSQQPDPPGQPNANEKAKYEAYLFAHMTHQDYGRLKSTPGYADALQRIGAPKLFYDKSSEQYLLTWHTPHQEGTREDPTLIPSPDGQAWYLYYEQYPGVSYGLSVSDNLNGPWFQVSGYTFHADWDKYSLPASVRHGCMIPISGKEYQALVEYYGLIQ
jgi:hypothetical protein